MKKNIFICMLFQFFLMTLNLSSYYFDNNFLEKYSLSRPYFEGNFYIGGDEETTSKIGTYMEHFIKGKFSLDDLNTPSFQIYYKMGFIENLWGMNLYYYNNSIEYPYENDNDINIKLQNKIFDFIFYQNNKIYNNIYAGILYKGFYQEYKYLEDKSLVKQLLSDEYNETKKIAGIDIQPGIRYYYKNLTFTLLSGAEIKNITFENSEDIKNSENKITGIIAGEISYNLSFTIFMKPIYITLSTFYNKNYFDEYYGCGIKSKIKYFSINLNYTSSHLYGQFLVTPIHFFSINMAIEKRKIEYNSYKEYKINKNFLSIFMGITLRYKSLGIPAYRNNK